MNQSDVTIMNFKAPPDVRESLEKWSANNLTPMGAEVVRAVRERAEREREKATG